MFLQLKGIAASPGVAIGTAHLLDCRAVPLPPLSTVAWAMLDGEVRRLEGALAGARDELLSAQENLLGAQLAESRAIIHGHEQILRDPSLLANAVDRIRNDRLCAEWAWTRTVAVYREVLSAAVDPYLAARAADLEQLAQCVLRHLARSEQHHALPPPAGSIIVARDLTPADTAQLNRSEVAAFATDVGTQTSHTAVVARALAIPAVVGLQQITAVVRNGDTLVVDGHLAQVLINPPAAILTDYRQRAQDLRRRRTAAEDNGQGPAVTRDGLPVRVTANLQYPDEIGTAMRCGADGIGLLRTEFLFLNRGDLPSEEEQARAYREVVDGAQGSCVTIRTVDLGADKLPVGVSPGNEVNPALGLRGVRLSLQHPETFQVQLRAILRASVGRSVRVMLPVVSSLEELRTARRALDEAADALRREGVETAASVPVGVMIEVPSAVAIADLLAAEADFFSIGSNDLIQYALAADRGNQQVAYLYQPLHPAMLRLLATVARAARARHKPVCICGEMAGEALHVPFLLGLGLDALSTNAPAIPEIKRVIRTLDQRECVALVERAMQLGTTAEIANLARAFHHDLGWSADGATDEAVESLPL